MNHRELDKTVWTYEGQAFGFDRTLHLKSGLAQELHGSLKSRGPLAAVVVYDQQGMRFTSSYEQLLRHALVVAAKLKAKGHHKSKAALLGENSYLYIVHFLALTFLGCEIALLNPREGPQLLEKRRASLGKEWKLLFDPALAMLAESREFENLDGAPEAGFTVESFPLEGTRLRIFTSGSTGESKIVCQPERAILANVDALIEIHKFNISRIRLATPMPLFHVNAMEFSLLCGLVTGQTVVIYASLDWKIMAKSLVEDEIDIFSGFPQLMKQFLGACREQIDSKKIRLKYAVTAASALSPDLARRWCEICPWPLIQGYGLSETTNFSCLHSPFDPPEEIRRWLTFYPTPSIGEPVLWNEVVVLSSHGDLLEPGEIGEIGIRGWNVMTGYEGGTDPFFRGYFPTGDLGYFLTENGRKHFFIVGRIKDSIKTGGESLSLREVDDELARALDGLEVDAISVGFENDSLGEAHGVVFSSSSVIPETLQKRIQTMAPALRPKAGWLVKDRLRTASGKPERWKFQSLFSSLKNQILGTSFQFLTDHAAAALSCDTERSLESLLQITIPSADLSRPLGGQVSSLELIAFMIEIEREFKIDLVPADLNETSMRSVQSLSRMIQGKQK
jgi:acyl-CoA synthetase (AMP-forming)/AMP-acid ligase II/acyl carrier protein